MTPERSKPLKALVDSSRGISYGVVQPGQHVRTGVPIVRVGDIRNGRISQTEPLRVADDIASKYRRTELRGGELLLTLVGTVGETAIVPSTMRGWNTARAVAVIPVLEDPGAQWIRYVLMAGVARQFVNTRLNTTVQATLNLGDVSELPIPLPSKTERERILQTLGALDDKIELNRKMNETLEQMAQAIFKSWFIDFDGHTEFEDSELGRIPKGWRIARVEDLILDKVLAVGDGYRAQRTELAADGLPFARAGNIDNGFRFDNAEYLSFDSVAKAGSKISQVGDVVFTSKGTVGRFAYVASTTPTFVYSPQLCFWRSLSPQVMPSFLLYWMRSREFLDQVAGVKGQTDMAEYVSLRDQRRMKIRLPPAEYQSAACRILDPLLAKVAHNHAECETLAKLRDTLLPKLISGELRVRDMEAAGSHQA